MTPRETVILTRYVKACCPQQAIDEFTPDAWSDLLGDLALDDCRAAVTAVAKRQPFVAPAEIRAEVARIRNDRIARSVIPAPPPELTDHPRAYQRALQDGIGQAATGRAPLAADQPPAIIGGTPRAITDGGIPVRLGGALAELKRKLGPARARSQRPASRREIAARQAAESRRDREAREAAERGEAS